MKNLLIIICLITAPVFAQLSPGKLHQSHANLEGLENCSQCHEFKKRISDHNCLHCHQILAERIKTGKGLHVQPDYAKCEKCHIEHHGRDYDLIYWPDGKNNFNHQLTGYSLQGKHATLQCNQCHRAEHITDKVKFTAQQKDPDHTLLGLDTACLSCHADEHRSQLDTECLNCHNMNGWKPAANFDHQATRFALTGKHLAVDCGKCHTTHTETENDPSTSYIQYKGLAFSNCTPCHQDVHKNRFGDNCKSCHETGGWQQVNRQQFNHDLTAFPLKGKHAAVNCQQCHLPGRPTQIAKFDRCTDCHRDYHAGQFDQPGHIGNCEKCHNEMGFTPATFTIVQHNELDFKLKGGHISVPCNACHPKSNAGTPNEFTKFRFASTSCVSCHPDPHNGQVANYTKSDGCQACHTVESWRQINFNHKQTRFPLTGKHALTTCAQCHVTESSDNAKQYVFTNLPVNCQNCHKDTHVGQFRDRQNKENVTDCSKCHTPTNWIAEKFNHNRDASFQLKGAHQFVDCNKCHAELTLKGHSFRLYKPLRSDCKYCHGPGNQDSKDHEF